MKSVKKLLCLVLVVMMVFAFAACSNNNTGEEENNNEETAVTLKIGTFAGISHDATKLVADVLESKYGYTVEIIDFDGNTLPCTALKDGELDMVLGNALAWVNTFCEQNNCDLSMIEPYYFYTPLAIYSAKWESLDEIPQNAQIIIPSDSSNMNNSLILLEEAGLLTMGEPATTDAFLTTLDIEDNPLNIEIIEGDITSSARSIEDVDAVVAVSSVAASSGNIDPFSYLYRSSHPGPIGFIIRTEDASTEWAGYISEIIASGDLDESFNEVSEGRGFLCTEWE